MLDIKNKATLAKKFVSGLASLLIGLAPQYSFAIDPPPPPASEAPQTEAQAPQASKFTEAELEKLLAPIALYPDALLAHLLPTYAWRGPILRGVEMKAAPVSRRLVLSGGNWTAARALC
jgi:hypothetical protein